MANTIPLKCSLCYNILLTTAIISIKVLIEMIYNQEVLWQVKTSLRQSVRSFNDKTSDFIVSDFPSN